MNPPLLVAGLLALACGVGHSYLGERLILVPLFRSEGVPRTPLGGVHFTKQMIRFTWHFFSVMAWSSAGALFVLGLADLDGVDRTTLRVIATHWAALAVVVALISRGRHRAWLLMTAIAVAAGWGTL